jgi:hypothetical protein
MKAILVRMLEDRASLERIRSNLGPDLSTSAEVCAESIRQFYAELLQLVGEDPQSSPPCPIQVPSLTINAYCPSELGWSTGFSFTS